MYLRDPMERPLESYGVEGDAIEIAAKQQEIIRRLRPVPELHVHRAS